MVGTGPWAAPSLVGHYRFIATHDGETSMKEKTYRFFSDPGHGWLEVDYHDLLELGIERQISRYSYRKGRLVYLEEDCDMAVLGAFREHFTVDPRIDEVHQDPTPIRNYPPYDAPRFVATEADKLAFEMACLGM